MRLSCRLIPLAVGLIAIVVLVGTALAALDDWGLDRQTQLQNKSEPLFGVGQPLTKSSTADLTTAQGLANPAGLTISSSALSWNAAVKSPCIRS